jgi:hypothetical protein
MNIGNGHGIDLANATWSGQRGIFLWSGTAVEPGGAGMQFRRGDGSVNTSARYDISDVRRFLTNQGTDPLNPSRNITPWAHWNNHFASPLWNQTAARLNGLGGETFGESWQMGNSVNDHYFIPSLTEITAANFGYRHPWPTVASSIGHYWVRSVHDHPSNLRYVMANGAMMVLNTVQLSSVVPAMLII